MMDAVVLQLPFSCVLQSLLTDHPQPSAQCWAGKFQYIAPKTQGKQGTLMKDEPKGVSRICVLRDCVSCGYVSHCGMGSENVVRCNQGSCTGAFFPRVLQPPRACSSRPPRATTPLSSDPLTTSDDPLRSWCIFLVFRRRPNDIGCAVYKDTARKGTD